MPRPTHARLPLPARPLLLALLLASTGAVTTAAHGADAESVVVETSTGPAAASPLPRSANGTVDRAATRPTSRPISRPISRTDAPRTTLRHVHGSGQVSSSGALLERDLDFWMAQADVVTLTEMTSRPGRVAALDEAGWAHTHVTGPRHVSDGAIAWRTAAWTLVEQRSQQVTELGYARVTSGRRVRVGHALTALLRSTATGDTVLVSTIHLPSLVEAADGRGFAVGAERRVAAYRDGMRGWRAVVRGWTERVRPDARVLGADWNLDHKRGWARRYLDGVWADDGFLRTWRAPYPRTGTYVDQRDGRTRRRLIDATSVDGAVTVGAPQVLGRVRSSDHRPYRVVLRVAR